MSKSVSILSLLVALAFFAGGAAAAYAGGNKWALLVGVDRCKAVGELTVCAADAQAMKFMLERIGYPADHITLLEDNQSDFNAFPTLGNVERAIKRLVAVAEEGDTVLFFFSGHGVTVNGTSYLVPTDGDLDRGVSLNWIKDRFAACKAKEKVMILDACHAGAAKGVEGITPDLKTSSNLVMLLSCEKDQVSWPDTKGGRSVFTAALVDGLSGMAANADGKVTHRTLADYVRIRVKGWTFKNQKGEQTPTLVSDTSNDIVLADLALMKPDVVPINVSAPLGPSAVVNNGKVAAEQPWSADERGARRMGPVEGEAWVSPTTGMEFVWVPALNLWAGKFETTNGEYRKKEEHDSWEFEGHSLNGDRQPVAFVDFDDAVDYAEWLTEQDKDQLGGLRYRLPTESEWQMYAQCGDSRVYPWGDSMPPKFGNYADRGIPRLGKIAGFTDGFPVSCPVEKSGKNSWGLYGVGGNVYEFCATDESGTSCGAWRGASWTSGSPDSLRCTARFDGGGGGSALVGFRLVLPCEGSARKSQQTGGRKGDGESGRTEGQRRGLLSRLIGSF